MYVHSYVHSAIKKKVEYDDYNYKKKLTWYITKLDIYYFVQYSFVLFLNLTNDKP